MKVDPAAGMPIQHITCPYRERVGEHLSLSRPVDSVINSAEIEMTWSVNSPLTPLYQRGVLPPFAKGRSGGIYGKCRDNLETTDKLPTDWNLWLLLP